MKDRYTNSWFSNEGCHPPVLALAFCAHLAKAVLPLLSHLYQGTSRKVPQGPAKKAPQDLAKKSYHGHAKEAHQYPVKKAHQAPAKKAHRSLATECPQHPLEAPQPHSPYKRSESCTVGLFLLLHLHILGLQGTNRA